METDAVETERQAQYRNAVLTVLFFGPLLWAFLRSNSFYPITAWNMFSEVTPLGGAAREYFILRGETAGGRIIEISPAVITRALGNGNEALAHATAENLSFFVDSPYPRNSQFWTRQGTLPHAARMNELLLAWGTTYNNRNAAGPQDVLRALQLDAYEWPRADYSNFAQHKKTWRIELPTP